MVAVPVAVAVAVAVAVPVAQPLPENFDSTRQIFLPHYWLVCRILRLLLLNANHLSNIKNT